ncbi:MAG: proton-conducting membrane transporter [Oscillospiraceae bacterium]|nr:proton-conducting membrane transporter [Oscillospiraceae bacterium]
MSPKLLLIPILLPILAGAMMYVRHEKLFRFRNAYALAAVCLNSCVVWCLILFCKEEKFEIFRLTQTIALTLRFDPLGRFFAGLIATLWPLTTLYAIGYMRHEHHRILFFSFFLMSYGVTMGIATAGNMITLYCFYEMLTLSTVALVIHPMTDEAVRAARQYVIYSIGGAAFAFIGIMYLSANGLSLDFLLGGSISSSTQAPQNIGLFIYVLTFLGLSVKAAIFPFHDWLPKASVAPTPVTALLHAVAVVKAGAFAVIRLTYYVYGARILAGTWAQTLVMGLAAFTVVYGSAKAVKQTHWKRRLAYSTVSNLSYILFGATLMTQAGMAAALLHMLFHAIIKILAFFCAGCVLHMTGRKYLHELDGLARKMPVTFATFTVSALSLTGIPPLTGFVSKFQLLAAASQTELPMAYVGMGALLVSALLTAIYMFTAVVRAYFPAKDADLSGLDSVREADKVMLVPMVIIAAAVVLFGLFAGPFVQLTRSIASGIF